MDRKQAEDDMMQGFLDGLDPDAPVPSGNRSYSYRHGFANGRDDLAHNPRASAQELREEAERCIDMDTRSLA